MKIKGLEFLTLKNQFAYNLALHLLRDHILRTQIYDTTKLLQAFCFIQHCAGYLQKLLYLFTSKCFWNLAQDWEYIGHCLTDFRQGYSRSFIRFIKSILQTFHSTYLLT